MTNYRKKVQTLKEKDLLPYAIAELLVTFYQGYRDAVIKNGLSDARAEELLDLFLDKVIAQTQHPVSFASFHRAVRKPFDYYQFGLKFVGALVQKEHSALLGKEHVVEIIKTIERGENVILVGNHQIEPDPQAICLLLSQEFPDLAEQLICVAGHRVTSDPMAVPFSLGCNLLCIYSKKHIDHPPEERGTKLQHNRRTMKQMAILLEEGGKCIWIAPSGGRDRPTQDGSIEVASFDPQSIEMLLLIAKQAKSQTHFYPLALATYPLFPPPNGTQKELGEPRLTNNAPIFISFGERIDMDYFPGHCPNNKRLHRHLRADYIWSLVNALYSKISLKA